MQFVFLSVRKLRSDNNDYISDHENPMQMIFLNLNSWGGSFFFDKA